ncbi:hypothetical protein BKA82DRAFT_905961 [Pisolithus tinctorius]|uniref:Uncharacterized protein n=1 Tax=Pisolithus tinctorius Marx 270 TaxID=870435 RepID=A0A0C3JML5_PISTI|nr:hypothetical protein BKA82DRAFT_905961 [Pisolithus tinctorius]KIO10408.1 hypothetical protein M404DRAFT_905961 [Pisolithus tinctorius Marx 270]
MSSLGKCLTLSGEGRAEKMCRWSVLVPRLLDRWPFQIRQLPLQACPLILIALPCAEVLCGVVMTCEKRKVT